MKIPFISGEGREGHLPVNLFFSPKKIYGRDALVGRPGLAPFCDTGYAHEVRGLCVFKNELYAVVGKKLFSISISGVAAEIGSMDTLNYGPVWTEANETYLAICDGKNIWTFDGTDFEINDPHDFTPGSLVYEGGYFLSHGRNTKYFYESEIDDPTDFNELEYAITTVSPDTLKTLISHNGEIYAMGEKIAEMYYNAGSSGFSFAKIPGGNIPVGAGSTHGHAESVVGIAWLANDRTIVLASGNTPTKISNAHTDELLSNMGRVDDCRAFSLPMMGHVFYVFSFPSEDKTCVYDSTVNHWYLWSSYADQGRWRANCHVYFSNQHFVGDHSNGKIYTLDMDTHTDNGETIVIQRAAPVETGTNNRVVFPMFEIDMETGVGVDSGDGSDPKVMMQYSTDKGKTWSNEQWRDIGKVGEYETKIRWRRLGMHYHFTPRITITDPVKVVITGAYIGNG